MKPTAKWTDDCQGKKDYDGSLIDISTRYWPRGGGFSVLTAERQWLGNEARPDVRPSASASLLLRYIDDGGDEDYIDLVEQSFEAETQEEVQRAVEAWVQAKFDEVSTLLREHFRTPVKP